MCPTIVTCAHCVGHIASTDRTSNGAHISGVESEEASIIGVIVFARVMDFLHCKYLLNMSERRFLETLEPSDSLTSLDCCLKQELIHMFNKDLINCVTRSSWLMTWARHSLSITCAWSCCVKCSLKYLHAGNSTWACFNTSVGGQQRTTEVVLEIATHTTWRSHGGELALCCPQDHDKSWEKNSEHPQQNSDWYDNENHGSSHWKSSAGCWDSQARYSTCWFIHLMCSM